MEAEKNERNWSIRENGGSAKSFMSILLIDGLMDFTDLDYILYTAQSKGSYKKNQNQKLLQGLKWEETKKMQQKGHRVKLQER